MTTRAEMAEMISGGENTTVEFKEDAVDTEALAKELVALTNFEGGSVILGVDDNGAVVGITRVNLEEWVMNVCRDSIRPAIIPELTLFEDVEPGRAVAVLRVGRGTDVHSCRRMNAHHYYIRVGTQSREASTEELRRLFQQRGLVRAERVPVSGAWVSDLDIRRLRDYFFRVLRQEAPESGEEDEWEKLLMNSGFLNEEGVTLAALLLFGKDPMFFANQSGINSTAFSGDDKDYDYKEHAVLNSAMVSLFDESGNIVETGLVEGALEFVRRNTGITATLEDGARRVAKYEYPEPAVREAIVNALVHRDYFWLNTKIELSIYNDRMEIISPGKLPNGITTQQMITGVRSLRNQQICHTMSHYRYVDDVGMGISRKIVKGMLEHNGTQPEIIANDHQLKVVLYK